MACKWNLQFQGKLAENATTEVNQFLDGKISADIKENDIPAKVDNMMEKTKRIWLTLSTVKQDLANVRRHAQLPPTPMRTFIRPILVTSLLVLIAINNGLLTSSLMSARRKA